jgi:hypothetical protein
VYVDAARLKHALFNVLLVTRTAPAGAARVTLSTRLANGRDAAPQAGGRESILLEILDSHPGTAMRLWIPATPKTNSKE